jgi:hypothetical protein
LGGSRDWPGLMGAMENYNRVTFEALSRLDAMARIRELQEVFRAAEVRYADIRARLISKYYDLVTEMGGPEEARTRVRARGQAGQDRLYEAFAWCGGQATVKRRGVSHGESGSNGGRMGEERSVSFGKMEWTDDAPGIRAREADVEGARWAMVEYEEGVGREELCEEGHRGYVISGEIEYEFDDGREPLRAAEGEAFLLPSALLGGGAHRGRNLAAGPTRLFLIDDSSGGPS